MGFYITGDTQEIDYIYTKVSDLRQHINLSAYAFQVISDDMINFSSDISKITLSGFLNTVFKNFYFDANASISQRYINKNDELQKIFNDQKIKTINSEITNLYISKILDLYESDLIKINNSYPKGIGKKFRINKENLDILRESSESIYYDDNIGQYLKAIFEEYALLHIEKRELIYFKNIVDTINVAILKQNKIKISILQKINTNEDKFYTRKFYITPYKIITDRIIGLNYLLGFSEEIFDDGSISNKHVSSFRISRLDKVNIMSSMSGFIPKSKIEEIEKSIIEKGPQFMAGDLIDVKIKLSKKGIESFNRQIYMRPNYYLKEDDIYFFNCTEVQIINYFFKFGKNAKILEPVYLKNKFKSRYKDAFELYNE